MNFEKRLKIRFYMNAGFILIGAAGMAMKFAGLITGEIIPMLGLAVLIIGFIRLIRYKRITSDKESFSRQRIVENDERNIMICTKARSTAAVICIFIFFAAIIFMDLINFDIAARIISYIICVYLIVYIVSYLVIKRRY